MSTIYCPNCGAPNTADSVFCASCGASLESLYVELSSPAPLPLTAPPPPPPPTTPTIPPSPMTYEQPELMPDGEPYLVERSGKSHRLWKAKRFNELLALWERKFAKAEKNAVKGYGLPIALIIIGFIVLAGIFGIIIIAVGINMYSNRSDAKKNLTKYRGVLFYLRDYVSKYGMASITSAV